METIEYRSVDKSGWQRGPWDDEPDKKQWLDEETGLPCLAVRHPRSGNWCGYVGVPEGHRYFEQHEDAADVEVHGGLSYANFCSPHDAEGSGICHKVEAGEQDHVWWLGFDCHHAWDLAPGANARDALKGWAPLEDEVYRDLAYVESECRSLARQLA